MDKKITYIVIGLVLILGAYIVVKDRPSFGSANGIVGFTSVTDSTSTVGINNAQVMATSSGLRKWLYIANDGAVNAYCLFNTTTTVPGTVTSTLVAQQGVVLASTTGILNMDASVYAGPIWCATKAGTTTLNVVVGQ